MRLAIVLVCVAATASAAPKKKQHDHGTLVLLVDRSGSMQGKRLDGAKAAVGTNYLPAFELARKVLNYVSGKKHVVLLSDGQAPDFGPIVDEMREAYITTSAIGIGEADRALLNMVSVAGDGDLYMVEDLAALPKVMTRDVAAFLPR